MYKIEKKFDNPELNMDKNEQISKEIPILDNYPCH
jgi:hypothetical protein